MRKGLPKSDLQLTQKGLTAKTRRELRAQRKKQVAEAEQRELDLAVEHFFRVADTVNDHRAIVRDGWGVDHGYTSVSFSSPSRKSEQESEEEEEYEEESNQDENETPSPHPRKVKVIPSAPVPRKVKVLPSPSTSSSSKRACTSADLA